MREIDERDPVGVKALLLQIATRPEGMSQVSVGIARHFLKRHEHELDEQYIPTGARTRLSKVLDGIEQRLAFLAAEQDTAPEQVMVPAEDPAVQGFRDEISRLDAVA